MAQRTFPENLLARMEEQENGCIYFTGSLDAYGYGQLSASGRKLKAHRAAYELFVGPIPEGHDIDHECHNQDESCAGGPSCPHRRCVNWEHLAAKTRGANLAASPLSHGAKTHCKRGHEFTEANTYHRSSGGRDCRTCHREWDHVRRPA